MLQRLHLLRSKTIRTTQRRPKMNTLKVFALVILFGCASLSQAATITRFSPQGSSSGVRQIVIDFDRAAVTFGEAKLPAPVKVQCSLDGAAEGSGR